MRTCRQLCSIGVHAHLQSDREQFKLTRADAVLLLLLSLAVTSILLALPIKTPCTHLARKAGQKGHLGPGDSSPERHHRNSLLPTITASASKKRARCSWIRGIESVCQIGGQASVAKLGMS